ncbi:hypothetical protein PGB90_004102 [Kerria lacca]
MRAALVFGFTILTVFQTISSHAPNDDPAVKECTTELNLAPDFLKHFEQHGKVLDESHKNSKCFFFCVKQKNGIISDSGNLNHDKFVNHVSRFHSNIPKDKFTELSVKCYDASTSYSDSCEKYYNFATCIHSEVSNFTNLY